MERTVLVSKGIWLPRDSAASPHEDKVPGILEAWVEMVVEMPMSIRFWKHFPKALDIMCNKDRNQVHTLPMTCWRGMAWFGVDTAYGSDVTWSQVLMTELSTWRCCLPLVNIHATPTASQPWPGLPHWSYPHVFLIAGQITFANAS